MPRAADAGLHGLLDSLDANSSYLNPEEYRRYKEHKETGTAGIGAFVSKRFGYAALVAVLPGSPAESAGLSSGDIIESGGLVCVRIESRNGV